VKVGDLLRKRSTGKLCVYAEEVEEKYGNGWIKVLIDGKLSKWVPTQDYEVVNESR